MKKYQVVIADPPWRYENSGLDYKGVHGSVAGTEKYYSDMNLKDIQELKIPFADDCWLFMWATDPLLLQGLETLKKWGFKYRGCYIWNKQELGMGWFHRIQHEFLIIGKKGKPKSPKKRFRSVYSERRTKHSKKPIYFHSMIEKMFPDLNKLEIFARDRRQGWNVIGNQVPNHTQALLSAESFNKDLTEDCKQSSQIIFFGNDFVKS